MARAISDSEKVKIASSFIHNAPPGEFNEVFSDVRALISNDQLLKDGASQAFAEYNMEQFIPAIIGDGKDQVIVSRHGLVDGGRFLDPRTKRTFKYDHLKKEASDVRPTSIDERAEAYRAALEASLTSYAKDHYPNGVVTVYGSAVGGGVKLIACIEDHKYNPNNFWNGRWRSEWSATISGSSTEVKGSIKVQVHYYEDGNVQLVTSKDFTDTLKIEGEAGTASNFVKLIHRSEDDYQSALNDNYKTMSQTTFKALRRQLPVTRTKIDWDKILFKNVRDELRH